MNRTRRAPELLRLLADSRPGDVLLVEQVDRLSRLNPDDWRKLRHEIEARQVRVVSPELPLTWLAPADDFTTRMLGAINAMLLDMLAAIAQGLRRSPSSPGRGYRQGPDRRALPRAT